jgi:DNA polymerase III gamma/tau subunit
MSDHFNNLPVSDGSEEIRDPKHLRNTKKKLGNKEQKMKGSPSPELQVEINKLRILIREYEDKDKPPTSRKKKKKKEPKKAEDFDLNEIKKFNKQREREVREENERKKEEKRKRDEESAKYWKNYKEKFQEEEENHYYRQRRGQSEPEKITIEKLLKSLELAKKELPDDIREIIDHFDKSKWKKLCMKYHPDKCKEGEDYGILLNGIKDHFEENKCLPDETWTK